MEVGTHPSIGDIYYGYQTVQKSDLENGKKGDTTKSTEWFMDNFEIWFVTLSLNQSFV